MKSGIYICVNVVLSVSNSGNIFIYTRGVKMITGDVLTISATMWSVAASLSIAAIQSVQLNQFRWFYIYSGMSVAMFIMGIFWHDLWNFLTATTIIILSSETYAPLLRIIGLLRDPAAWVYAHVVVGFYENIDMLAIICGVLYWLNKSIFIRGNVWRQRLFISDFLTGSALPGSIALLLLPFVGREIFVSAIYKNSVIFGLGGAILIICIIRDYAAKEENIDVSGELA